jgi:hypothetical protein
MQRKTKHRQVSPVSHYIASDIHVAFRCANGQVWLNVRMRYNTNLNPVHRFTCESRGEAVLVEA